MESKSRLNIAIYFDSGPPHATMDITIGSSTLDNNAEEFEYPVSPLLKYNGEIKNNNKTNNHR